MDGLPQPQMNHDNQIVPAGPPMLPGPHMPHPGAGQHNLLQTVWRGKWIILFTAIIGLGGAFAYVKLIPEIPLYQSTATILIERPSRQAHADIPQPMAIGATAANYLQTQVGMMSSGAIIGAALSDPNVLALPSLAEAEEPAQFVHESLSVDVAKKSDVIFVTAKMPYPDDAATFVNAVIKAYIAWHENNRQDSTADLLASLRREYNARLSELDAKRGDLLQFEELHPEMNQLQTDADIELIGQINANLETTRMNAIRLDSYHKGLLNTENDPNSFRQYVLSKQGSVPVIIQQEDRSQIEADLSEVRRSLEEMETGDVPAKRSTMDFLRKKAGRLQQKLIDTDRDFVQDHLELTKNLLERTDAEIEQMQQIYREKMEQMRARSSLKSQYSLKLSDYQITEELCRTILGQINQLDLSSSLQRINIHVLQRAMPSGKPIAGNKLRTIALGLLLGLAGGVGLSFLREWRDNRVRSADEITAILPVPILGCIPAISKRKKGKKQYVNFSDCDAHVSEVFRAIRTALFFGQTRNSAVSLLITSPGPQEGKTTLISNLGIAMAQTGQRTVIVDADLRRPAQHRFFGLNGTNAGLVDVMLGQAILAKTIRSTGTPGLDVLTSGRNIANPGELLNNPSLALVLEQLKEKYDRVLVDSSPVGIVTDAQILSVHCGLTLMVLRADKTLRMFTERARDALHTVGAQIVGVVVNDVSKKNKRFGHYSDYGSYYHAYGSYEQNNKDGQETAATHQGGADSVDVQSEKAWGKLLDSHDGN